MSTPLWKIATSPDVSYTKPVFDYNDTLHYISDQSNWWNIYKFNSSGVKNIYPVEAELGEPHWIFGSHCYAFDPKNSGKIAIRFAGKELGLVDTTNGSYRKLDTGYCVHTHITYGGDQKIYCFVGDPSKHAAVIAYDLLTDQCVVIRKACDIDVDPAYLSIPEHISFPTTHDNYNSQAFGYYYPPANPNFVAPPGTSPPLVVMVHGGPTGATFPMLDLKKLYYTTRGFAILDVNYRGSVLHGRTYRQLLREKWGVYDVDDACQGALHLASLGKADPKKLCITGGSAGGYLVLAALTFRDVFAVGASHYGISDVVMLQSDTHKFEARYNDTLLGPWPEAKAVYEERSPINSIDKLNVPVIFFQGTHDKVVPLNQAEVMFSALKKKALATAMVVFEGEGHGFRRAENIQLAIDGEYYFFCSVLGIPCGLDLTNKLTIHNLKTQTGSGDAL